jgi:DNA-binding phage protein
MVLTRSFTELVQRRIKSDKKFAEALLREGIDAMLSGDLETGKTLLRDYIKATVGFEKLAAETGAPSKSLIRMFGPRGNPQAKNLFSVIGYLQKQAGLRLHVAAWRGSGSEVWNDDRCDRRSAPR